MSKKKICLITVILERATIYGIDRSIDRGEGAGGKILLEATGSRGTVAMQGVGIVGSVKAVSMVS